MVGSHGTVLIPAAGLSARFGGEGPKGLLNITLPHRTDSMIGHVARSVPEGWTILLVVPEGTAGSFRRALLGVVRPLQTLEIRTPNGGQADSIRSGLRALRTVVDAQRLPLIVHNCDVVLSPVVLGQLAHFDHNACVLHRDETGGSAFSYVDDENWPRVWAEKQRISDWAQTGAWRFRSPAVLEHAMAQKPRGAGETYLSHHLHDVPEMVGFIADGTDWVDLGTPDAVRDSGGMIIR